MDFCKRERYNCFELNSVKYKFGKNSILKVKWKAWEFYKAVRY